jgi:hypothetical protein
LSGVTTSQRNPAVSRWLPIIGAGFICIAISGVISLTPVWATGAEEEPGDMKLSMAGRTVQLEPSLFETGEDLDSVSFQISGPDPQDIKIEIVDFVVLPDGTKSLLPAGSTEHTLQDALKIGTYETDYIPDGTKQSFSADLIATEPSAKLRFGGVRVSMAPKTNESETQALSGVSGVMMIVMIVPEGFDGELPSIGNSSVESSPIRITPLFAQNLFEMILPDIPGVINRGPIAIDIAATSQATNPVLLTTHWLVNSGSDVLFSSSSRQKVAFPGSTVEEGVELVARGTGSTRPADLLAPFDFVAISARTEARLGSHFLGSSEVTTQFLVLRWKEPFAISLSLGTVGVLIWRSRRQVLEPARD